MKRLPSNLPASRPFGYDNIDPATFSGSSQLNYVINPDDKLVRPLSATGIASATPITIGEQLMSCVHKNGDALACKQKRGGQWHDISWAKYYEEIHDIAAALVSQGFQAHQCVNILGVSSYEWSCCDLGAILVGGMAAGIYPTNSPQDCHYILNHSKAHTLFVHGQDQLQKLLDPDWGHSQLSHLNTVVVWGVDSVPEYSAGDVTRFFTYNQFRELGRRASATVLTSVKQRMKAVDPGHCSTLVYTSGTTGRPKAVMLSHDNITWASHAIIMHHEEQQFGEFEESGVAYLPLSHIAGQLMDIHLPMRIAAQSKGNFVVWYDEPRADVLAQVAEVRPTFFMGVPRMWEKFIDKLRSGGDLDGVKDAKALLGLDRTHVFWTGAAPVDAEVLAFFWDRAMPVCNNYGLSETTGPAHFCLPSVFRLEESPVGVTMPGVEVKVTAAGSEGNLNADGELCYRGRHIMMGFMYDEEKTKGTFDDDGWLLSGDVGHMDEHGLIYITGRIKELLITSGGENVPPVPVEEKLKLEIPAIANAMLIGDGRKFLTCLICPRTEEDPQGVSTADAPLLGEAKLVDPTAQTIAATHSSQKWADYIQAGIDRYNETGAVSRAQRIQKFELLPVGFSRGGGELTPTLKLRRNIVLEKYAELIDGMYQPKSSL